MWMQRGVMRKEEAPRFVDEGEDGKRREGEKRKEGKEGRNGS